MATKKKELQYKSPAEFFADNRQIAGFDNPGKCLFTSIRELVENGLDACETGGILPRLEVDIEEMNRDKFNKAIGVSKMIRLNEALYHKDTPAKTKKSKDAPSTTEASADAPLDGKPDEAVKGGKKSAMFYRVTVTDNGIGMPHDDIPNMFGRVLAGTKYGVKQARGKFGLGAKMALIWSKMSTGQPLEVRSATVGSSYITHCRLDIDIHKNEPRIIVHEKLPNPDKWHGATVSVLIEGSWSSYRAFILQYMRQMAIITPYAHFQLAFQSSSEKSFKIEYARRTDVIPDPPAEVKHHPASANQLLIKQLLGSTKQKTIVGFLANEFSNITRPHAAKLVGELEGLSNDTPLSELTDKDVGRIAQLFREAKFDPPSSDCLSPIGEYNLRLGIMKVIKPEMVATYREDVGVHEGHPFLIEVGVSIGGAAVKPGINVFRFANRIPLMFEKNGDVVTQTAAKRINWSLYKINKKEKKIGIFASIVSTKIPFKGTGKEYIGDDIIEIRDRVKTCIAKCCAQLRVKIMKNLAAAQRQNRKRSLMEYIPNVVSALSGVLNAVVDRRGKRVKVNPEDDEEEPSTADMLVDSYSADFLSMLQKVADKQITPDIMAAALKKHVEQTDTEAAMEYVESLGLQAAASKDEVFIAPLDQQLTQFLPDMHSPVGVWRMML